MKRNPKLAHDVTDRPEIQALRHAAIDKFTSIRLLADMLARATAKQLDAQTELDVEDRVDWALNEAAYAWNAYRHTKRLQYEDELQKTIVRGTDEMITHSNTITDLLSERGINASNTDRLNSNES